jgi:acyl carrier protein
MKESEIRDKIIEYVVEVSLCKPEDIVGETLLFEEGFFDSMGLLYLIDFIRDEFHFEVMDDDLITNNFESINKIVDFVTQNLKVNQVKNPSLNVN